MLFESGCRDEIEVSFAGQRASQAPDGVFHSAFLPGTMRIAEEGLETDGLVKPVMLGELVSVVKADGFAHRLWKFAELTSNSPGGEDSFSIDRVLNDAEAGLSFVENQQALAASGEQHEVGFPMARCSATFDLGRPFGNRAPLFDEVAAAAPVSASCLFAAWQQLMPVILLGRPMIDETID